MTGRPAPILTIVMYHVVGRAGQGVLGRLKTLDVSAFRAQLAYIRRHYSPIDLLDVPAALDDRRTLPPRPIVLSFDDGYAVHAKVVLPLLAELRVPAVFFPVSASLLDRTVLDVNKIQCLLAAADDVGQLVETIDAEIERERGSLRSRDEYRLQFWKPSRWDPPEIMYVKRMLQHGLPERVRRTLVDRLFTTIVTADERAIADELYMTVADVRAVRNAGMTIGAHADRHVRLATLTRGEQAVEIDGALRVLDEAGVQRTGFAYSYANGEYNLDSVDLLRALGCAAAVTTRPDLASLDDADLLTLPRLDANDLPINADAPANQWTRRAAGEIAS